ncbi:MAG: HEAT repeat domain-containing protein, partial [Planctomycetes bacterium]|nr:HEAT repeat domain-containing protein [Planctomycetota bacterium]
ALAAWPFVLTQDEQVTELALMALHSGRKELQGLAAARIMAGGVDVNLTEHLLGSLAEIAEPVRGIVGQFLASDGFDRYWRSYKRLDKTVRAAAGKALLKLDGRVADLVAGRLAGRDVGEQLQATQIVRQLKLAGRFLQPLCRLARHGNVKVRSAATAALGEAEGFDARTAVARCLDDTDPRVQANAVEALAMLSEDASAVADKVASPYNRVRANATKWLLQQGSPQAEMALATMLTDIRPPHRISALWVVKKLNYEPAADIVQRMAMRDEEPAIRARAAECLKTLKATQAEEVVA